MRTTLSMLMLVSILGMEAWILTKSNTPASATAGQLGLPTATWRNAKPNFASDINPIFQARCQPCHFQGGKVYDRLPFDKPETIIKLGTKLFTRIKDEKEQQKIREFLDQD